MVESILSRMRALALRAAAHLATARLIVDLTLDSEPLPDAAIGQLHSVQAELIAAQEAVQAIVGAQP